MLELPKTGKPVILVGTRPEIIKMAPLIRALRKLKEEFSLIYTGQHYDYNLSLQFIEELDLPAPTISLLIRADSPDQQLGLLVERIGAALSRQRVSIVLVEGDTNSVLAGALAANKLGLAVGHVEAGLRSYDLRMPEEHNRRIVDHISSLLFAPTRLSKHNLKREAVWGRIFVTGNTVIDACIHDLALAEKKSRVLEAVPFEDFALATIHRAENVDNPHVLNEFVQAFLRCPAKIVLPLHPRTKKRLKEYGLWAKLTCSRNLLILPPQGFFDFLMLMKRCSFIITDSGGIQEEATAPAIRKKVIVLRQSTERPEAVKSGFAKIAGCRKSTILRSLEWALERDASLPKRSPFGNGHAAEKIATIIAGTATIGS